MNLDGLRPWAGLAVDAGPADVIVAGIPYDGSAVYRRGAASAPAEMRRLSRLMPPSTESGRSLDGLRLRDLGDIEAGDSMETGWRQVAGRLAEVEGPSFLTVLGGDHCSAIPVLAAEARRHPELAVLWVDAHPDLDDFSRGGRWTCGCALRRALEVAGLGAADVALAGCRDFDREELELIKADGIAMLEVGRVAADPAAAGAALAGRFQGRPLHVSIDIDVLDPAHAPGTEIPSRGGLGTRELLQFLGAVAQASRLVGMDMVEIAPNLDPSGITVLAGLKVIFEMWGHVWKPPM